MSFNIGKMQEGTKYEITVSRNPYQLLKVGRYEIRARLNIGDGEMANMFFNEHTFPEVLKHLEELKIHQPHLHDAAVYYLDNDEKKSRYDLNDDNIQVMLTLVLSDLDRV